MLEAKRIRMEEYYERSARTVQRCWWGYVGRRIAKREVEVNADLAQRDAWAAVLIQRHWKWVGWRRMAKRVRKRWLHNIIKWRLLRWLQLVPMPWRKGHTEGAVGLQRHWRRMKAWKNTRAEIARQIEWWRRHRAAIKLQSRLKAFVQKMKWKRLYERMRNAAVQIQKIFRGWMVEPWQNRWLLNRGECAGC